MPENYFGNCLSTNRQFGKASDFIDGLASAKMKTDEIKDTEKGEFLDELQNLAVFMNAVKDQLLESICKRFMSPDPPISMFL